MIRPARLVLFVIFVLARTIGAGQSYRRIDWPPPNPENVGNKKASEYWTSYVVKMKDAENSAGNEEVQNCLDKFNFHQCKDLFVFSAGSLDIIRAYLPPFRATLPSVEYRFRELLPGVHSADLHIPNQYIALAPANLVDDGPTVLEAWKSLAASAQPFECKESLCNLMYISNKPVGEYDEGLGEKTEGTFSPIDPALSNVDDRMYIIFCSQYMEVATKSAHPSCIPIAVIYSDGSAFLAAAVAQSPDDLLKWPPPNPDKISKEEVNNYWASYVTRIEHTNGKIQSCLDQFNGLTYRCKVFDANRKRDEDDERGEVEALRLIVPPFRATLPRIGLRVMLESSNLGIPNQYIALVPVKLINDGRTVLKIWKNLAASEEPFGCKQVLCDVMYFSNEPIERRDDTQDEDPDHKSMIGGRTILPSVDHSSSSNIHAKKYIIFCSQYVEGTFVSERFSCTTVAVIYGDGRVFLSSVVVNVNDMSDIDLDLRGGDVTPISVFSLSFAGARDSRPQVRSLIQAALSRNPNPYSVLILPGGSILAQRSYVPDEIVRSIWNTRTWYEKTWLRFDLVPTDETYAGASGPGFVSVFFSMVVEHSKTPDKAEGHWHPASDQESQAYQEAILARLTKEIASFCKPVPDGDGEEICKAGIEKEEFVTSMQAARERKNTQKNLKKKSNVNPKSETRCR